jgi:hypothetical protein
MVSPMNLLWLYYGLHVVALQQLKINTSVSFSPITISPFFLSCLPDGNVFLPLCSPGSLHGRGETGQKANAAGEFMYKLLLLQWQ